MRHRLCLFSCLSYLKGLLFYVPATISIQIVPPYQNKWLLPSPISVIQSRLYPDPPNPANAPNDLNGFSVSTLPSNIFISASDTLHHSTAVCPPCPLSPDCQKNSSEGWQGSNDDSGMGGNGEDVPTTIVSPQTAQMLYEDMILGRTFEDRVASLYFKGKVTGFVHLYNGQEAVGTGVIKALRKDDYAVSTYRDHVHALSKGVPPNSVMAELYGKSTGCSKGRGGSMHLFSKQHNFVGGFAFIGEQIPVALGIAYSIAYRRSLSSRGNSTMTTTTDDQVVVCFLGDGTSNNGQFYESLNIAALAKLPIIFVVENNNWAIGMAHYRSTAVPEVVKKGPSFGLPSVEVDGMDVLAVRAAARKAIKRARAGYGPSLIEALTYRIRGHSVADPDELRARVERQTLSQRDPLVRFTEQYMKPNDITSDYVIGLTKQKVRKIVDEALAFAESSADPCPTEAAAGIFAEKYKPPLDGKDVLTDTEMKEYADALRAELLKKSLSRDEARKSPGVYVSTNPMKVID